MVDALRRIISVCDGVPDEFLLEDLDRSDIILWRLTVLGEAAKSVSEPVRAAHPEVEWSEAARLRDRVVHHYDGIDAHQIAYVVRCDLPALLKALVPVQVELHEAWEKRQTLSPPSADW